MRFSVDAHAIGRHLTGNEVYVRNLLNGFASLDDEAEFIAYLSVEDSNGAVPAVFRKRLVAANPFLRLGCDLSIQLHRDRPELIHVQYTAPVACPVPIVVSVHDVSFLEHPEYFAAPRRWQLRQTVAWTIHRAARVLTLSEFSRSAISQAYGLNGNKVTVVPAAISGQFRPMPKQSAAAFVEGRFKIRAPYILTVGDLQPRKNHIGLIRAFERLAAVRPEWKHRLVLVGKDTWYSSRVHQAAQRSPLRDRIHFTGYVDEHELLNLYGACEIFVFPSFYEGFGIPILEAMACGRAVACSGTSAMPEVADTAALLFDPHSTDEIVRAMHDLLVDGELRGRMERLAQMNAARFSWRQTARKTLDVYYEVASGSARRAARSRSALTAARR